MSNIPSQILHQIEKDKSFESTDYISRGWEIVQQNLGGFIGFTVLYMLISSVTSLIPGIGGAVNSLVVSPCLTIGFYLVAHLISQNKNTEFGDFFKGFDYLGKVVVAALVQMLIYLGVMIPFILIVGMQFYFAFEGGGMEDFNPIYIGLALLLFIPIIYLAVSWMYTYHFIVFNNLEFWPAMESSRKLVGRKFGSVFGFGILLLLLNLAGMLALFVGLFVTVPITMCAIYVSFADQTDLGEEDEMDDISSNLI